MQFIAVQTVFEGYATNTFEKLRHNQLKYDLKIPMAHAPGNPESHTPPDIMRHYRSGGTPWVVIIDPAGTVAYNDYHFNETRAKALIDDLAALQ